MVVEVIHTWGIVDQPGSQRVKNISEFYIPGISGASFWQSSLGGLVGGRGVALHPATPANKSCQNHAPKICGI
jgi:hypothetical protein